MASESTTSFLSMRQGLLAGDLARLQLAIEKCPGGPHQAMLEADQMAVGGLVRFDQPLGVKAPALDVGAVEGEGGSGVGNALFDDRRKLELVAGPGLMGGQRPRGGREIEVVELLHLPRLVGDVEREDKLADLARVAEQPRGMHVGCRRGRAFGFGGDPDAGRPGRQAQDLLVPDDLLDLLEPGLVMGEDRIADELFFLECLDDVAVVGGWQPFLPGNLGRDGLHLALDLGEGQVGLGGKLGRRNVDADLLESERVQLGRQAEILAGPGQDLGLDELHSRRRADP